MLNFRIEIDTDSSPYKVKRMMPDMLEKYFTDERDWKHFCNKLDRMLQPYEEIKAVWMIIGVIFVLLFLGLIAGIICTFLLVDDDDVRFTVAASLFGSTFVIFSLYFFLMQFLVIRKLEVFSEHVNEFCDETAAKWDHVQFRFQRQGSCSVYWDADFKAWINVTSTDPVDLT